MIHDYYLMRKNEVVTIIRIDDLGNLIDYSTSSMKTPLAPLCEDFEKAGLKKWWKRRSVPIKREGLNRLLRSNGISLPEEFLINNLGLSLNDYYWIKPVDASLRWEDVNFFDNDFKADTIFPTEETIQGDSPLHYTPNSSLNGNIEKTWCIMNGERCLIKGNSSAFSWQSANEVVATKLHATLGYDNYTHYRLIPVRNKKYPYGCICTNFCTNDLEFISAWDVLRSEPPVDGLSEYEHFIVICGKHGMNMEQLRQDLEYQILTDFLITNEDRHLGNLGILRDADSLQFLRMAPIFDSGNSMFYDSAPFTTREGLLRIGINSFYSTELQMLQLVTNPSVVDLNILPSKDALLELYYTLYPEQEDRILALGEAYERKKNLLNELQQGKLLDSSGNLKSHYSWITEE